MKKRYNICNMQVHIYEVKERNLATLIVKISFDISEKSKYNNPRTSSRLA